MRGDFARRLRRLRRSAPRGLSGTEGSPRRLSEADGPSLWALLEQYIPNDHARQVNATYYVDRLMEEPGAPRRVLDLGCGRGDSVDQFRRHNPDIEWIGVDIAGSQEVEQRRRTDAPFVTYDGERVPFPNDSFDLVYSRQVLEHVPDPMGHLREIVRILRTGGSFIGSTSQLEPYHSMSYWNFTPVGFVALAERAGLRVLELRPGIDGVTLPMRTFLGRPPGFDPWWTADSPLNQAIDEWGLETGRRPALINLRKLHLCGQFAFHAVRDGYVTNGDLASMGVLPGLAMDDRHVSEVFEAFATSLPANEADVVLRVGHALAEAAKGLPAGSKPDPDQPPRPRG